MTDKTNEKGQPPIEIPPQVLSSEALLGVIEAFILREGTDYGRNEIDHQRKVDQVQKQLERGHIKIIYDSKSESVTLMTEHDWKKLSPGL